MTRINCLHHIIQSGGNSFPIFIGFLPASEILAIAEAPSFETTTPHHEIADNVLTPPIRHWQRPLDGGRVQDIAAVFDDSGKLMPNPVLLAVNVVASPQITAGQQTAAGGVPTSIWEVEVPVAPAGAPKPLWILDGQHRINGLAASHQSGNPVPLVLLLNRGITSYSGPLLAELFAQVTTSAAQLDPLHHEWLTYAFDLESYATTNADASEHKRAMETASRLCQTPTLDGGQANPFFNEVQFNHYRSVAPAGGGFAYPCAELKELIRKAYYASGAVQPYLDPADLASQIGLAYVGLQQSVPAPHAESVFFGPGDNGHKIVQDAFLIGVLSYLLNHPPVQDWRPVLAALAFPTTNWNFRPWVRSLGGRASAPSRRIAIAVFKDAFTRRALPPDGAGTSNIVEFLRGNDLAFTVEFSHLTPVRRPRQADRAEITLTTGARRQRDIRPRSHGRVVGLSKNIGNLVAYDGQAPPGRPVTYPALTRAGMLLDATLHAQPLEIVFQIELYGGNLEQATLTITW